MLYDIKNTGEVGVHLYGAPCSCCGMNYDGGYDSYSEGIQVEYGTIGKSGTKEVTDKVTQTTTHINTKAGPLTIFTGHYING